MELSVELQDREQIVQIAKIVGERIQKIRLERKKTQTECAKEAQIAKSHLSQIESGKRIPSLEKLFDLCKVLGIKMADIFVHQDLGFQVEEYDKKRRRRPRSKEPV